MVAPNLAPKAVEIVRPRGRGGSGAGWRCDRVELLIPPLNRCGGSAAVLDRLLGRMTQPGLWLSRLNHAKAPQSLFGVT